MVSNLEVHDSSGILAQIQKQYKETVPNIISDRKYKKPRRTSARINTGKDDIQLPTSVCLGKLLLVNQLLKKLQKQGRDFITTMRSKRCA